MANHTVALREFVEHQVQAEKAIQKSEKKNRDSGEAESEM